MKVLSIKEGFEPRSSGWNSGALSQSCSRFNVSRGKHNTHMIINTVQTSPVRIFFNSLPFRFLFIGERILCFLSFVGHTICCLSMTVEFDTGLVACRLTLGCAGRMYL